MIKLETNKIMKTINRKLYQNYTQAVEESIEAVENLLEKNNEAKNAGGEDTDANDRAMSARLMYQRSRKELLGALDEMAYSE